MDLIRIVLRNPVLRLATRLRWLIAVGLVAAAMRVTGVQLAPPFAVFADLASMAPVVAALAICIAAGHLGAADLTARARRRLSGRSFVCPDCLQVGPPRYACEQCGKSVENAVVEANGAYSRFCAGCEADLFPTTGPEPPALLFVCPCCSSPHLWSAHVGRGVRLCVALLSEEFARYRDTAPHLSRADVNGTEYLMADDGRTLTFVFDAERLPKPTLKLLPTHAAARVDTVLTYGEFGSDPAVALRAARNADALSRRQRHSDTRRRRMCLRIECGSEHLGADTRRMLSSRFTAIQFQSGFAALLGSHYAQTGAKHPQPVSGAPRALPGRRAPLSPVNRKVAP
jgi:hypothetical protein